MQNESDLKLKKQKEFLIKFCYFGVIIGTTIIIIKVLGSTTYTFFNRIYNCSYFKSINKIFLKNFILTAPLYPYYLSLHFIQLHLYNNFDWSKTFNTTSKFIYNITTIFTTYFEPYIRDTFTHFEKLFYH